MSCCDTLDFLSADYCLSRNTACFLNTHLSIIALASLSLSSRGKMHTSACTPKQFATRIGIVCGRSTQQCVRSISCLFTIGTVPQLFVAPRTTSAPEQWEIALSIQERVLDTIERAILCGFPYNRKGFSSGTLIGSLDSKVKSTRHRNDNLNYAVKNNDRKSTRRIKRMESRSQVVTPYINRFVLD